MTSKVCTKCKENKPLTDFYKKGFTTRPRCKVCANADSAARYKANPEKKRTSMVAWNKDNKLRNRGNRLRRKYWPHLTWQGALDEYDRKFVDQGGHCAFPGCLMTVADKSGNSLNVDHNKKTGRVRGLLCSRHNYRVVARHTIESAKALYEYLLKYDVPV